ncbi:MAG: C10 family peptidase, partial [Bacteroidales bacterium]|nr:C10 family peptidase [Bacteroidales bacterium]
MKKIAVLIVLLTSFFLTAMSDSPKEEPKQKEITGPRIDVQKGQGFITEEELNRIAINYYKYMFEEEHEWKSMKRKEGESIINNIVKYKADSLILAYMVSFNPDGHVLILSNKNYGNPFDQHGSGIWKDGTDTGEISIYDNRHHMITKRRFDKLKKDIESGNLKATDKDKEKWIKFNVPNDEFHDRASFDGRTTKPDWWLEKKKSKNTEGMIKTEWNQFYPFNKQCPPISDSLSLVGCTPLAMAQILRKWEWPLTGIGTNTDTWPETTLGTIDFSTRNYDYGNLPAYADSTSTEAIQLAVSTLCLDAGVSLNANYASSGTDAFTEFIPFIITKHFNFTSQYETEVSWFPNELVGWKQAVIQSMQERTPIIYAGLWDPEDTAAHTWIADDYDSTEDEFHYNLGWKDTLRNNWYPAETYIDYLDRAIFNILPDKTDNAMTIPFKENFENVMSGEGIVQIPKSFGTSRLSFGTMDNIGNNDSKAFVRDHLNSEDWFLIKKINLICESVPVLKFKYKIDGIQNFVVGDSLRIEVSNDNRITWNRIASIDHSNFNSTNQFADKIISLYNYKNQTVNIRFRFFTVSNPETVYKYYFDDIEIGKLELSFPELTNDMTLPPKTAQPIKVSPSIVTPPKSKGFEDYDMIMDFYVKEDIEEAEYALAYSDSVLENGVFEFPNLNTDNYMGKDIKIRAYARTKSSLTTLDSIDISLKISGRECSVDLPLPATESWFDFETRLNFAGSILAEPSFVDSLDNVLIGFDVYDDYQSQVYSDYYGYEINISIFDPWYIENYCVDSTNYFCNISKEAKSKFIDRESLAVDKEFEKKKTVRLLDVVKQESTIDGDSKDYVAYPAFTARYPRSLDLYPGTYTVFMMAIRKDLYEYDGTISEIARHDSLQFIIPQWKLKMRKDFYAPEEVPYVDKSTFEKSKNVEMIVWRPWIAPFYNPYYIDIIRISDNQTIASYVKNLEENNDAYNIYNWPTDQSTESGYYEIKTKCLDSYVPIEVKQDKNMQMCPFFVSWENAGAWSDSWSGSDGDFWKIHWYNYSNILGNYALGAVFNTAEDAVDRSISSPSVSLDKNYDAECQVLIGIPTTDGINFDELKANYSALVSQDGGSKWTMIRTALVSEYEGYSWNTTPGHKFLIWSTTIKNTGDKTVK